MFWSVVLWYAIYLYGQIALVTLRVWVKPGVTGLSDPRSQATDVILCPESYYYPVSPYLTLSLFNTHYSHCIFPRVYKWMYCFCVSNLYASICPFKVFFFIYLPVLKKPCLGVVYIKYLLKVYRDRAKQTTLSARYTFIWTVVSICSCTDRQKDKLCKIVELKLQPLFISVNLNGRIAFWSD